MAGANDEKRKLMEAEMNRFEAEIALPVIPPPPPPSRPAIVANTYRQVQKQLEQQQTVVVPHMGPPMGFQPMMPPIPPRMLPVPARPPPIPARMPSIPVRMPPNPANMPPGPPRMPGGFPGMAPPPPPPPPPLLIPHQVQRGHMPVRHSMPPGMGMGPPPMMGPPPPGFMGPPMNHRPFIPPPMQMEPPVVQPAIPQITASVSATAKLYGSKSASNRHAVGEATNRTDGRHSEGRDDYERKNKRMKGDRMTELQRLSESNKAKEMADRVKASTVVSVGATGGTGTEDAPVRKKDKKPKKVIRTAGGQTWEDNSLVEWEDDDFRIFCGDLGNDVTDEVLTRAFSKYPSFLKSKVVRDKRTNKTKGFGFVSFKDPQDFIKAMKEMNGRYVGSRPIKLRKSSWRSRNMDVVRKKEKEKTALIGLLTGR